MSSFSRNGQGPQQSEWSERFCLSRHCRAGTWFVQPDTRGAELWLIAESPEGSPWTVAAHEPICPFCGEALEAHVEGVGEIEAEPPPTLLSFLRGLGRAA
jgi:hypothetical protein